MYPDFSFSFELLSMPPRKKKKKKKTKKKKKFHATEILELSAC